MLTAPAAPPSAGPRALTTTLVFGCAILVGSGVGAVAPVAGQMLGDAADRVILLLVGLLFFELRLDGLRSLRRTSRMLPLALGLNFVVLPVVAAGLTLLLPDPAIRLGAVIYCLAPCTDWFLGFTRLARGDTTAGAALLPIQMALQLTLYPLWIAVFAGHPSASLLGQTGPTLLSWFVLPAAAGLAARVLLRLVTPARWRSRVSAAAGRLVPAVIAVLIVCLFAANMDTVLTHPTAFAGVLAVVFLFFACSFALGEGVSRIARLDHREHVLLAMTTSARNAPMMLAVTTVALPHRPLVSAAIVLGMLVEFPHLTALTHVLRKAEWPRPPLSTPAAAGIRSATIVTREPKE